MSSFDYFFGYDPATVQSALSNGLTLGHATIIVTILLELASHETALTCYRKDKRLYFQAIGYNFLNHYGYGVPLYVVSVVVFAKPYDPAVVSSLTIALQVLGILLIHSVCYYEVHKTFHSSPGYYKYHRFHHRFNVHVPPFSANAVGFVEYWVAYVLPFTAAAILMKPYEISGLIAAYTISMCNLLIHTPPLQALSERNIPGWWVSTKDHMDHHAKLSVKYAAPTVNVDWVVDKIGTLVSSSNKTDSDHNEQSTGNC